MRLTGDGFESSTIVNMNFCLGRGSAFIPYGHREKEHFSLRAIEKGSYRVG